MRHGNGAGTPPDAVAEAFASHLRAHATRFYPDLVGPSVSVELLRRDSRRLSGLYEFEVGDGERARRVLGKSAGPAGVRGAAPGGRPASGPAPRPALVPWHDPAVNPAREHAALAAIEAHFRRLGDPRFGAVRVLDLLPDGGGFLMERVAQPTLRRRLRQCVRWRRCPGELCATVASAGSWLRSFHSIRPGADPPARQTTRAALLASIRELSRFVGGAGRSPAFAPLGITLAATAGRVLPERLPLGLSHGDFAPRNILVHGGGRITVLDTRALWRTAVYEDIGYFLASLEHGWPHLYSGRLLFPGARLRRLREAFLTGYFQGDAVPRSAIQVYVGVALLDRAAWVAAGAPRRAGARTRIRLRLLERALRGVVAGVAGQESARP